MKLVDMDLDRNGAGLFSGGFDWEFPRAAPARFFIWFRVRLKASFSAVVLKNLSFSYNNE